MFKVWDVGIWCEIMWVRTATVAESSERSNEPLVSQNVVADHVIDDGDLDGFFWTFLLSECGLIVRRLVSKFPAFYGTRSFIIMFTRARPLSLSWARLILSTPFHPVSSLSVFHFILPSTPLSAKLSVSYGFRDHCFPSPQFFQALLPSKASKAYKAVVLRITYEMRRERLIGPALSGFVNSCILLFPFCILHLLTANAEGKFMKQVNEFLTTTYII
jgi:hypothetical protein